MVTELGRCLDGHVFGSIQILQIEAIIIRGSDRPLDCRFLGHLRGRHSLRFAQEHCRYSERAEHPHEPETSTLRSFPPSTEQSGSGENSQEGPDRPLRLPQFVKVGITDQCSALDDLITWKEGRDLLRGVGRKPLSIGSGVNG
jgi:hypothetical protein